MPIIRFIKKVIARRVKLMPGNEGKDCPANGEHKWIECQCDECDYLMCCLPEYNQSNCTDCDIADCLRRKAKKRCIFSYLFID